MGREGARERAKERGRGPAIESGEGCEEKQQLFFRTRGGGGATRVVRQGNTAIAKMHGNSCIAARKAVLLWYGV